MRELQAWYPDIIYSNNTTIDVWFKLSKYLRVAHVWHVREFWWADYSLLYCPSWREFLNKLNQSDLVIFISQSLGDYYKNMITARHTILLNPIASTTRFKNKHVLVSGVFTFLAPWYIHKNKGQFIALQAFRELSRDFKNVQLLLLWSGSRSYILFLKIYCRFFWLKNVIFLWYLSDPEKYFRCSHAVLVCSKKEALWRVTLEAMMYWVPVIWRNTAGTKELIWDNRGLTFNESYRDLADKMKLLLSNPELCQFYSDRGVEFINSFFIKDSYVRKLEKLLYSLIKNKWKKHL